MVIVAVILSLWPTPSLADIWVCPQPDGTQAYRDYPADQHCLLFKKESSPNPNSAEGSDFRELARRARKTKSLAEMKDHDSHDAPNFRELARRANAAAAMAERELSPSTPEEASTSADIVYLALLGLTVMSGTIWMLGKTGKEILRIYRKPNHSKPSCATGAITIKPLPDWQTPAHPEQYDYDLVPFESKDEGTGRGYVVQRLRDAKRMSWKIPQRRQGFESIAVSGESHHLDDLQADSFRPPARLRLVPEPTNRYDPHAIAVWDAAKQYQAGYIPRDEAERIGIRLRKGHLAQCLSIWETFVDGQRVSLRVLLLYQEARIRIPQSPTRS